MHTFVREGILVTLTVCENPRAIDPGRTFTFAPEFITRDERVGFEKSMRIFRIEKLGTRKLHEGEVWSVLVDRIEPDPKGKLTRDQRVRVYVYVKLKRRIEQTSLTYDPLRQELSERCVSGTYLVRDQTTSVTVERKAYRRDDSIIEIEMLRTGNRIYYGRQWQISREEYLRGHSQRLTETFKASPSSHRQAMDLLENLPIAPKGVMDAIAQGRCLRY